MKKLAINPSNKKYYSDDYIKGWENGVNAQYEATKDAVSHEDLQRIKFHQLPYTQITPSDVDAEAYKRGWNDAIDVIISETSAPQKENYCPNCGAEMGGK